MSSVQYWWQKLQLFLAFLTMLTIPLAHPTPIWAADPEHFTVIINQVRGAECCSPGNTVALQQQLQTVQKLDLKATWTVRYDALLDANFVRLLQQAQANQNELGVFLEVTPKLAQDSGVIYTGSPDTWYEAQHAYLVGYSPTDRRKLIDTVMEQFRKTFGTYPTTTTAWIIDTPSLQHLREKYGVQLHQITREQWGTDSYTLSGGPPHLPYFPSQNWALIPASQAQNSMPIIARQTIADPVENYGDHTSSFTSQPNDYARGKRTISYFQHLFRQAHSQTGSWTFALLGLENSFPPEDQREFATQLEKVAQWRDEGKNQRVVTANQFATWLWQRKLNDPITTLAGESSTRSEEKAWWITTPQYRVRVRLSAGSLFVSDVRPYSQDWDDPYATASATRTALWVTPFILDGSRFWQGDESGAFDTLAPDTLWERKPEWGSGPTRWSLGQDIDPAQLQFSSSNTSVVIGYQDAPRAEFSADSFWLSQPPSPTLAHRYLRPLISQAEWRDPDTKTALWGFHTLAQNGGVRFTPLSATPVLGAARQRWAPLLFPELRPTPADPQQSSLFASNRYARAGRNPVRLVFSPRDQYGYPAQLPEPPQVTSNPPLDAVQQQRPSGQNGSIWIDLHEGTVGKYQVTVRSGAFSATQSAIFAPNCLKVPADCAFRPQWTWWWLRTWMGDSYRSWLQRQGK